MSTHEPKSPLAMTLDEIQKELRSYRPGVTYNTVTLHEFLERRSRLWKRLDELVRLRETYRKRY
jgi:hypothetical protein